jgi:hypothetical protein
MADIIKDSSIWSDPHNMATMNRLDGMIRIGIVKGAFNDTATGELRYLVEIQNNSKKINMNCRMMRRFGGVYNYEDYIDRGYKTNDSPDPVSGFDAKAGDAVLVGQLNGQGREGIIIGGLTHAARTTTIQAADGPQYDAEFNGIHTNINIDGEWTLTFKGQPTNLSMLDNTPSAAIPPPTYDTTIGGSFMKLDKTGSWTATCGDISLTLDKPSKTATVSANMIMLTKGQDIPTEPFVLGNKVTQLLEDLIDAIEAISLIGNLGAPVTGLLNQAQFESIRTRLQSNEILSDFIMGEK